MPPCEKDEKKELFKALMLQYADRLPLDHVGLLHVNVVASGCGHASESAAPVHVTSGAGGICSLRLPHGSDTAD
eukprot:s5_g62.t1